MTDKTKNEEEPSIEEILNSIRQIISDEEAGGDDAIYDAGDEDIIDLTDRVDNSEGGADVDDAFEPVDTFAAQPVFEPESVFEPEAEERAMDDNFKNEKPSMQVDVTDQQDEVFMEKTTQQKNPARMADDTSLLTQKASVAAVDGFSDLVRRTSIERGGVTLEDMVRGELKPLLRDWLDQYLPSMIERLVKEELERISKHVLEE